MSQEFNKLLDKVQIIVNNEIQLDINESNFWHITRLTEYSYLFLQNIGSMIIVMKNKYRAE